MNKDTNKSGYSYQDKDATVSKHPKSNWKVFVVVILLFAGLGYLLIIASNNCSLYSDKKFSNAIDKAIEKAVDWVHKNEADILMVKNVALIKMLQDCNTLYPAANLGAICDKFMATPASPACWKGLINRNYDVQKWELNLAIKNEYIDNKWILYAIAPDKADITPEQMELYSREKWNMRRLTHQLWALIHLRKTRPNVNNEELINHLCNRIAHQLTFNIPVVDLYLQRIAFVLYAGFPEKIRSRWVERVINNQRADGGWNDRWLCFESIKHLRRPVFSINQPPSDQHATIQALWLMCQVKYRYPQYFSINREK